MPKVSVVLPVFNGAETILNAITSIQKQTFKDFELIIVNNGSTDHTENLIKSHSLDAIEYFHLENPDLVEALNFGLEHAKGEYIARMDADDYSLPDRLRQQVDYLDNHPQIGLVSGLVNYRGNVITNKGYAAYVNWANTIRTPTEIYLNRFVESALPHPSVMYRKELIQKFGSYKKDEPEDFELWHRWLAHGVRMSKVNAYVLDWYDSENRLSRKHKNYHPERFAEIKCEYFTKWFKRKFAYTIQIPDLYIFGYSSKVKSKTKPFSNLGLAIEAFIDVKHRQSKKVIHFRELETITNKFVLSYVSDRKGKKEIWDYLLQIGLKEGENFYMME